MKAPSPRSPRRLLLVGVVLVAIAAFVQACGGSPGTAVDSPAPSADDGPAPAFEIVAENNAYDINAIAVPAGTPFTIMFSSKDLGDFHDIDIRAVDKQTEIQGQKVVGGGESITYEYDGLPAGTYVFICSVHPVPEMTGTLTVK